MWWILWTACAGDGTALTDLEPDPSGDTSSGTADTATRTLEGTGDLDASCAPQPGNALRFLCSVHTEEPTDVVLEAWLPAEPERVRVIRSSSASTDHDLLLWGLRASSTYEWRAEAGGEHRTGQVITSALPESLTDWEVVADDPGAEVEGVLTAPSCPSGFVQIVDRDANIVWYEDIDELLGDRTVVLGPVHRTEDDTILMNVGRTSVVEIDLAGNVLLDLVRGRDFDEYIHHDLTRHDGVTYVLYVQSVSNGFDNYLLDGVYAFGPDGALVDQFSTVGLWPLLPHASAIMGYWTGLFPGAVDFSHANAVSVDAAGDVVVSFRHLHSVLKFRGGPGTPGFGEPLWTLSGSSSSILWPGDFALDGEPGIDPEFSGQHDAHFAADGSLLLFDNRFVGGGAARAMQLSVDEIARTAHVQEVWDTGKTCTVQGSVRWLGEHQLTTCSSGGHVFEFAPGRADPLWQAEATCGASANLSLSRGVPWDLWE